MMVQTNTYSTNKILIMVHNNYNVKQIQASNAIGEGAKSPPQAVAKPLLALSVLEKSINESTFSKF